ncbi:T9SS type A sorting domain-containing protein [Candidatus Poribacteria bacterium]|nr:T9SS type A sorting domain-containing protein [Candidatus Poribacteria bacterium]
MPIFIVTRNNSGHQSCYKNFTHPPAEVSLTIYAANGKIVKTLMLGYQAAGIYQSRGRAAYWDGRNSKGELVASGIYFYTLIAGDFTATKKMLIRK